MCSFTLDTLEIACFEYFKTIHVKFSLFENCSFILS